MSILRREDGRMEWVCEHGIGHTIWYPEGSDGLHGCDGCERGKTTQITKEFKEWLKKNPWFKVEMGTTFIKL